LPQSLLPPADVSSTYRSINRPQVPQLTRLLSIEPPSSLPQSPPPPDPLAPDCS
jgi:hypothetical protein